MLFITHKGRDENSRKHFRRAVVRSVRFDKDKARGLITLQCSFCKELIDLTFVWHPLCGLTSPSHFCPFPLPCLSKGLIEVGVFLSLTYVRLILQGTNGENQVALALLAFRGGTAALSLAERQSSSMGEQSSRLNLWEHTLEQNCFHAAHLMSRAQKRSDAVSRLADCNLLSEAALFQYADARFAACFREAS